jgi:hypothetical protein
MIVYILSPFNGELKRIRSLIETTCFLRNNIHIKKERNISRLSFTTFILLEMRERRGIEMTVYCLYYMNIDYSS